MRPQRPLVRSEAARGQRPGPSPPAQAIRLNRGTNGRCICAPAARRNVTLQRPGERSARLNLPPPFSTNPLRTTPSPTDTHAHRWDRRLRRKLWPTTRRLRLADTRPDPGVEKDSPPRRGGEVSARGKVTATQGHGQTTRAAGAVDTGCTNALIPIGGAVSRPTSACATARTDANRQAGNPDIHRWRHDRHRARHRRSLAEGHISPPGPRQPYTSTSSPRIRSKPLLPGHHHCWAAATGPPTAANATHLTPAPSTWPQCGRRRRSAGEPGPSYRQGNAKHPRSPRRGRFEPALAPQTHEELGTTIPAPSELLFTSGPQVGLSRLPSTPTPQRSGLCEDNDPGQSASAPSHLSHRGRGGGHAPDIIRVCGEANAAHSTTHAPTTTAKRSRTSTC